MAKSSISIHGIDPSDLDTSTLPEKDFYQYANGGWISKHTLPPDRSRYGSFDKLTDQNEKLLLDILKESANNIDKTDSLLIRQIGCFYLSGMDTVTIEKKGFSALSELLKPVKTISNIAELINQIAYLHKYRISPLFNFYSSPDPGNSNQVISHFTQGGLGLSDRDYYLSDDKTSKELLKEYKKHIVKIFTLAGETNEDSVHFSDTIIEIETQLAEYSMTRHEKRDPYLTYNKMDIDELSQLSPAINWKSYFKGIGLVDPGPISVGQTLFFEELSNMVCNIDINSWKVYLTWNIINCTAANLNDKFVNQNFEFYGKMLTGSKKLLPRWKRTLATCNFGLGDSIGQIYINKYYSSESHSRIISLIENLMFVFGKRIQELEWMSNITKKKALDKLNKMKVKIGYPSKWKDYSSVKVSKTDYLNNILNSRKFYFDYSIKKVGKSVDRDDWEIFPQTVNAYYNPLLNEIVFPAAILQPPFFYNKGDDAINYGAIGVVIGHEMTHGFDDQGRQYDKNGNLRNWWTKEDSKQFQAKTQVLIDQFNKFIVVDNIHSDGVLSLGENIADLGGLSISYEAYINSQKGKNHSEKIDGLSDKQRFFLSYSRIWAQNIRKKEMIKRTKEDVHSLGKFRVNGPLPNLEEFYRAFNIKSKSDIYIPKSKRAKIW